MKQSNYQLTAILENGDLIDLVEAEFIGEGIESLEDAIDAAQTALDYDGEPVSCVRIDSEDGFEGILDREGFHKV